MRPNGITPHVLIYQCKCGLVDRHGQWIEWTAEMQQKADREGLDIEFKEWPCPECRKKGV